MERLRTLTVKLRNGMEKRIAEHRQSKCESFEEKAHALTLIEEYKGAAIYYGLASGIARLLGDRQKELMLLLRRSDSMVDNGFKMQNMALEEDEEKPRAKKLVKAADSFIGAALITHMMGQAYKPKEKRILGFATDSIRHVHPMYAYTAEGTRQCIETLQKRWNMNCNPHSRPSSYTYSSN